jgi:hypothetical protein
MRLRFTSAIQVFEAFPTARDDIEQQPADVHPLVFLKHLQDSVMPEDAIGFCAYLLARREAVHWACQCIRATKVELDGESSKLIGLAEQWVDLPEEDNRRLALDAGIAAVTIGPPAWTAMAAGWSGGSILGEPHQPVPPPPHITAQLVRAAVLTSLAWLPAKQRREKLSGAVMAAVILIE